MKGYDKTIKDIQEIFDNQNDKTIENHSRVVFSIAKVICNDTIMNNDNIFLKDDYIKMIHIISLGHDIGKYENDKDSDEDHSHISSRIINNIMKKNGVEKYYRNMISKAIYNHSDKKDYNSFDILDKILIEADILSKLTPAYFITLYDSRKSLQYNYDKILGCVKSKVFDLNHIIKTKSGKKIYGKLYQNFCMFKISMTNIL